MGAYYGFLAVVGGSEGVGGECCRGCVGCGGVG